MRICIVALVLISSSIPATARPAAEWVKVRSPHFVVLTNSNPTQARRIAIQFERMRSIFHALFPTATDDTDMPITVLAVKDKKSFQALEPEAYLSKGQLDLAGFFLQSPDRSYILLRLDAAGEHPYAIIYHEYTHYLLRHDGWMPLWLNEGSAEFYQNTDIYAKEVRLGQPSEDNLAFLSQHRLLPLPVLFKVVRTSPYYHEEQKGSVFYAESWALTHYLVLNDGIHKTRHVQEYAQLLIQHQEPVTAAQQAFGDLNQLQRALNEYVQRSAFQLFKMKTPAIGEETSLQVSPIATADVDAIRADVLVNTGRTKEAEALLDTVLRKDPKNALAHETMGTIKFREGDIAGARKWYADAVRLDSDSYLAQYYFAALSIRSGEKDQDAEIESSLRTAIKLNPNFAPPYDALASFYASRKEKLDEAHMLNLQAVVLDPDNLSYRLDAASVLEQNQQFTSAIGVLKTAIKFARTQSKVELVNVRIDQIEQYQASVERYRKESVEAARNASVVSASPATAASTAGAPARNVPATSLVVNVLRRFKYPAGGPTGPRHIVEGVIRNVQCYYPSVITLDVEDGGTTVFLYNNDLFHIPFRAANYNPQGELHPCTGIEGMKARIKYGEVSDKSVSGQIVSVLLSK